MSTTLERLENEANAADEHGSVNPAWADGVRYAVVQVTASAVGVWIDGMPEQPGYSDTYVFEVERKGGVYYVVAGLEIGSGDSEWWEAYPDPYAREVEPREINAAHVRRHCLLAERVR